MKKLLRKLPVMNRFFECEEEEDKKKNYENELFTLEKSE